MGRRASGNALYATAHSNCRAASLTTSDIRLPRGALLWTQVLPDAPGGPVLDVAIWNHDCFRDIVVAMRPRGVSGTIGGTARLLSPGEFFSLGGVLAPYARTRTSLTPWLLSAAILLTLACWDPLTSGGRFDAILFGLAAYELLIGITRSDERHPVRVAATQPGDRCRR